MARCVRYENTPHQRRLTFKNAVVNVQSWLVKYPSTSAYDPFILLTTGLVVSQMEAYISTRSFICCVVFGGCLELVRIEDDPEWQCF